MTRDPRPMRQSRRTYRRRRCSWVEDSGWRCRSVPAAGSSTCLLHAPESDQPDALDRPAVGCEHNPHARCLSCHQQAAATKGDHT